MVGGIGPKRLALLEIESRAIVTAEGDKGVEKRGGQRGQDR